MEILKALKLQPKEGGTPRKKAAPKKTAAAITVAGVKRARVSFVKPVINKVSVSPTLSMNTAETNKSQFIREKYL